MKITNPHISDQELIIINKIYPFIPRDLKPRFKAIFELKPIRWNLNWDNYWDFAIIEDWYQCPQEIEARISNKGSGWVFELSEGVRKYDGDYSSISDGFLLIEGTGLFAFNIDGGVCELGK